MRITPCGYNKDMDPEPIHRLCAYCSPMYPDLLLSSEVKSGLCSHCCKIRLTREVLYKPGNIQISLPPAKKWLEIPGLLLRFWVGSISLLTIMGIFLLFAAAGLYGYEKYTQRLFSGKAQAVILSVWDIHSPRGTSANYIRYQYSVPEGGKQVFTRTDTVSNQRYVELQAGQSIAICYRPDHPESSRLDQFNEQFRQLIVLSLVIGVTLMLSDLIFTRKKSLF